MHGRPPKLLIALHQWSTRKPDISRESRFLPTPPAIHNTVPDITQKPKIYVVFLSVVSVVLKRTDWAYKWLWKEPAVVWLDHSRCSKWRPFAFTHAHSRVCHWSVALLMMSRGMQSKVSMLQFVNVAFLFFLCNVR